MCPCRHKGEKMGSHNLFKLNLDGLVLQGYSVAGEETVVGVPSLDVCFDIGKAPEQLLPVNHVLISHNHMDHVAGIAYYCSQRDFRDMAPGTVLAPVRLAPLIDELMDFWGRFDGTRAPVNIVPMKNGREYEIRRNLYAFAFDTNHTRDSLGYSIIDRRRKLKPEFKNLPGHEIAQLRKKGQQVTDSLDVPLVTYLGDTASGDFESLPCVRKSKILITECTFFDQDHHERARAGKHYHFDDLAKLILQMENDHIVITHVSHRTYIGLARQIVNKTLPPEYAKKVHFLMERHPYNSRKPRNTEA